jgi:hypothetical protein
MASEGEDGAPSEAKLVQETSVLDLQASYPSITLDISTHYPCDVRFARCFKIVRRAQSRSSAENRPHDVRLTN